MQELVQVLKIGQETIAMTLANTAHSSRDSWADFAKGVTIILVVMMHSTLGVQLTTGQSGFMADIVAFARAFRMPLFFAISGLFAASALSRSLSRFADSKLIHFFYFYALWSVLQIGVRLALAGQGNHEISWHQLLLIPIEPFGTIWFIYILPFFFLVARFARNFHAGYVLGFAAIVSLFQTNTGWIAIDASTKYLFFFLAGLYAGPWLRAIARWASDKAMAVLAALFLFASVNLQFMEWGLVETPVFALYLGVFGTMVIVAASSVVGAHKLAAPIRYCGRNSLAIYVAFSFPMVAARIAGTKLNLFGNTDLFALFVTAVALIGALAMAWLASKTPMAFLFDRPGWARLATSERIATAPPKLAVAPGN